MGGLEKEVSVLMQGKLRLGKAKQAGDRPLDNDRSCPKAAWLNAALCGRSPIMCGLPASGRIGPKLNRLVKIDVIPTETAVDFDVLDTLVRVASLVSVFHARREM